MPGARRARAQHAQVTSHLRWFTPPSPATRSGPTSPWQAEVPSAPSGRHTTPAGEQPFPKSRPHPNRRTRRPLHSILTTTPRLGLGSRPPRRAPPLTCAQATQGGSRGIQTAPFRSGHPWVAAQLLEVGTRLLHRRQGLPRQPHGQRAHPPHHLDTRDRDVLDHREVPRRHRSCRFIDVERSCHVSLETFTGSEQARLARPEAGERPLPGAARPGPRHHRAPRRHRARSVARRGHHRRPGAPDLRPGRRGDHRAPAGVRHRQGPRDRPVHHQVRDVADLARARRGGHRRPHDRSFDDRPPAGRAPPAEAGSPIAPSPSSSNSNPPR